MESKMIDKMKELWQGYSDKDINSLTVKLTGPFKPYTIVPITIREEKVLASGYDLTIRSWHTHEWL
jgi:galactose-1-phosphate uridylyltransferase